MHSLICCLLLSASAFLAITPASAQNPSSDATATCNFDSSKQVAVRYERITVKGKKDVFGTEIPYGKIWAPGGKPMTMFTNTPLTLGGREIPIGAYTLFAIPDSKEWTLIVSKSTDTSGKYEEGLDVARVPMQHGELPTSESRFTVYFAHVAPSQCNMRLDLQNVRAWVVIHQKK